VALDRQGCQELRDLGRVHLGGMPLAMKDDIPPDPVYIRFLRAQAHVPRAQRITDLLKRLAAGRRGRSAALWSCQAARR